MILFHLVMILFIVLVFLLEKFAIFEKKNRAQIVSRSRILAFLCRISLMTLFRSLFLLQQHYVMYYWRLCVWFTLKFKHIYSDSVYESFCYSSWNVNILFCYIVVTSKMLKTSLRAVESTNRYASILSWWISQKVVECLRKGVHFYI